LELSPYYLEATRVNNERFISGKDEERTGSKQKNGSLTLVEANCENMPFPDAKFDAVSNVYLFHEMPPAARRAAAAEYARVLKPGGKLFFVDSAQVGDGKFLGMEKAFDQALERFPAFNHEPYYKDYSVCDLEKLFGEFGFVLESSTVAWVSKCWCFTKAGNGTENAGASSQASVSEVPVTPREVVLPTLVDSNDASAKAR
jgi:SAM-dependent methyltransferase